MFPIHNELKETTYFFAIIFSDETILVWKYFNFQRRKLQKKLWKKVYSRKLNTKTSLTRLFSNSLASSNPDYEISQAAR